jgi:hypothetical protein
MRELQHVAAARLVCKLIWTIRDSTLSRNSFPVNVAFLLFTNSSSQFGPAAFFHQRGDVNDSTVSFLSRGLERPRRENSDREQARALGIGHGRLRGFCKSAFPTVRPRLNDRYGTRRAELWGVDHVPGARSGFSRQRPHICPIGVIAFEKTRTASPRQRTVGLVEECGGELPTLIVA